jgi:iron complex outermembrane receptor protein
MFATKIHTVRTFQRHRLSAALCMAVLSYSSVHAQTTSAQDAATATASPNAEKKQAKVKTLEEVTVTALKQAQPASKTPVALSVATGEDLKTKGVVSVAQIGEMSPGVIMARDPFGININIRGVTTTDQTSKGDQGIGFNIDGVPIRRPLVMGLSFFDVDRVEVLRGPQGTLYGSSTTGGVINVLTNQPGQLFDASADVEIGNYGTHRENAMVNIPVSAAFALRIAANANDRDGYIKLNDGGAARNDQHDRSVRISGLYTFSENTSLLLGVTGGTVSGVGYSTVPRINALGNSSVTAQPIAFSNPFGGHLDDNYRAFNTTFKTVVGGASLTYTGGVSDFSAHERTSATFDPQDNLSMGPPGAPGVGLPQYSWRNYKGNFKTYSNELRLANAEPGVFEWVVGANSLSDNVHESDHNLNALVTNPTIAGSTNGIDPVNQTNHKSTGLFGQATYHLNDQWALTAGMRYSDDKLKRVGTFAAGPTPGCTDPLADCIGGPNNGSNSGTKITYRLGAQYFISPEQMFYGTIATGYKPGGFNDFDPATGGVGPYSPEQLTDYELGYKGRWSDKVEFDSNLFYYDYAKDQVSSLTAVGGVFVIFTKSVPAKVYGWENELTYKVTPNDKLKVSASFEHSRYGQFMTGILQNVDWTGYSLDKTPHAAVKLSYSHEWTLSSGAYVNANLSSQYSTSYALSNFVNATQYHQKAYTRSSANLTYTAASDHYWFQLFVQNIEDKVQMTSVGGNADAGINEPRYFGVRFGVRMQ